MTTMLSSSPAVETALLDVQQREERRPRRVRMSFKRVQRRQDIPRMVCYRGFVSSLSVTNAADMNIEMDDFVVADDSDEEVVSSKKRKRPSTQPARKQTAKPSSAPAPPPPSPDADLDIEIPEGASGTAKKWTFDPENKEPRKEREAVESKKPSNTNKKEKVHLKEPEQRYSWLATIKDIDGNPKGHPDYDPRTIYIPPLAWSRFSPFEKQYWEIKQKFWDTVVFFKKGKF